MARFQKAVTRSRTTKITNAAGGEAFAIDNPAVELLTIVGSTFFNEGDVRYYSIPTPGKTVAKAQALDTQAQKIISLAETIAKGENPVDLLAIANWARTEGNMRTTPCVLLAVAAKFIKGDGAVRRYCSSVIQRTDEISQVFLAYMSLYGRPLPNSLKRGLADAFTKFDEYGFLKYKTGLGDVLKMVDRKKNWPVSEGVREFLTQGTISNPETVPMIAARKELANCTKFNAKTQALAKKSGATWDVLTSQFGSSREVWEIAAGQMPYMATLRNLRNLLKVEVSEETIDMVVGKLTSPNLVAKSRQLPFRFHSALQSITDVRGGWGRPAYKVEGNHFHIQKFQSAISTAMDLSVANVEMLPGNTVVLVDVSASMTGAVTSQKGNVTAATIARLMGAICFKISKQGAVIPFGTDAKLLRLDRNDSTLKIASAVEAAQRDYHLGHGTNAVGGIEELLKSEIKADRIILLSDMQCYGDRYAGTAGLAEAVRNYRNRRNQNCWFHSVDLVGYAQGSKLPADERKVNLISGWSEKIFGQIAAAEGLETKEAPSLDYVRENF